jgi:hypothetical protein
VAERRGVLPRWGEWLTFAHSSQGSASLQHCSTARRSPWGPRFGAEACTAHQRSPNQEQGKQNEPHRWNVEELGLHY